MSAADDAQPPNAAHSATIPRILIVLIPRPGGIQAQPEGEGKSRSAKAAREGCLASYCLAAGGFASGGGGGDGASGSSVGAAPRSSGGAKQSPAQSLVPLTVPTSLQAIGAIGFACFSGLPLCLGAAV
jgi:hypothetical protein